MFILKISLVKSFYALVIYKYCVLVLILFFFVWSYDIFLSTYSYDISNEDILNQQFFIINFIFNNKKKHSLIIFIYIYPVLELYFKNGCRL
jgi:membrane-associated PAP2 superfamily phosphatase